MGEKKSVRPITFSLSPDSTPPPLPPSPPPSPPPPPPPPPPSSPHHPSVLCVLYAVPTSGYRISNDEKTENYVSHDPEYDDALGVPDENENVSSSEDIDNRDCLGVIPFSAIHDLPKNFKSQYRDVFIPGEEVHVNIIDNERSVTTHPLNPNLYTVEFRHGPFTWTIKKRYKDIQYLHNQLKIYRASLNIPFPTKSHKERRTSLKSLGDSKESKSCRGALPRFPNRPDVLVPYEQLEHRKKVLEKYLTNLLKIKIYLHHPETINFLEVSHLSFIEDLGMKGKEGIILKRTGSGAKGRCNFCGLVENTFVAYIKPKNGSIKSVILMDNGFGISFGLYTTGLRNGIQIVNLSRHIVIKCGTRRKAKEWMEFIQEVSSKEGRDFMQSNPHNSFAPYRSPIPAAWFVDGSSYMSAVADALEHAKEEIFIADWWLSPEIYMKRPAISSDYWRLDKILERKAYEGVKVFIMIYKEVEVALGINSFYSKQRLVEKCPENIKVLRHPDHARVGVFLWAHHEKIVVVDQSIAFLGGIDLCYGRWDNNEHKLIDLGSTQHSSIYIPSKGKFTNTSTKKASSEQVSPFSALSQLDTSDLLLMQPIEESDTMKCDTPNTERKNLFGMAKNTMDRMKRNIMLKREELINMVYNPHEESSDEENVPDTYTLETLVETSQSLAYNEDESSEYPGVAKLWLGKDYVNFIVKDFNDLEKPYQDLVDRSNTPRMPWHDVGVMMEKARLNSCYPFLLPKSYHNCNNFIPFIERSTIHNVKCQVLRSVSSWSAGFLDSETVEQSIQEAYIEAISKAERYIYIENQFFITLAFMQRSVVKNRIGETLLKRILRAHKEGAVFRVFVIMPLLPGFEGEVGGPTGTALRAITHWNYASISRGKDAILNRLIEAGIEDPSEYITFHGLRTHAMLNGTLVTELIYVHSKLLIVDDSTVICGSANINDRSMIATRDSEIAVIIHDQEFEEGRMNDIPFPCGKFAGSLRKQLISEHLGLFKTNEDMDITDIIKKSFYRDVWCARSNRNTEIYETVFRVIPTDKVVNFSMLKQYQSEEPLSTSNPLLAQEEVEQIKGHLVNMPLNFLTNEDLKPAASTVEGIMPTALWT
ncbi:Phospholipase D1 [Melipona quadrifasciata]|uniref:Phospholipase n=1 Tax=Melipona quadrifasciata TaxID=166423 RepID=A0A0N0BG12_9HYME|nr:Phospholipase D1 [Melipona quadrifasciata]